MISTSVVSLEHNQIEYSIFQKLKSGLLNRHLKNRIIALQNTNTEANQKHKKVNKYHTVHHILPRLYCIDDDLRPYSLR